MLPTVRRCAPTSATSGISFAHAYDRARVDGRAARRRRLERRPRRTRRTSCRAPGGLPSCFCFTQPTTSRSPVAGRAIRDHPACVLVDDRHLVAARAFRLTTSFASGGPFGCAAIGTGADDRNPARWIGTRARRRRRSCRSWRGWSARRSAHGRDARSGPFTSRNSVRLSFASSTSTATRSAATSPQRSRLCGPGTSTSPTTNGRAGYRARPGRRGEALQLDVPSRHRNAARRARRARSAASPPSTASWATRA